MPEELLSQIYRLRKSTKLLSGMVSPAEKCKDCTIFNDVASIIPWKFSMNVTIAKIRRLLNRGNTGLIVLLQNQTIRAKKIYAILAFANKESSNVKSTN